MQRPPHLGILNPLFQVVSQHGVRLSG